MEKDIQQATIRLFKSIIVNKKSDEYQISGELLNTCLKNGFLLSNNIPISTDLVQLIIKELGLTQEQANNSFHKSWKKVSEAPIEQLILEQIFHYITTYGFKSLGVYNESTVFIPKEKLELPEISDNIKLLLIKGITKKELKNKIYSLIGTGTALQDTTLEDIFILIKYLGFKYADIKLIKNNELKSMLYTYLEILPEEGTDFLRYMIYNITEKSLLIKSNAAIATIKVNITDSHYDIFMSYIKKYKYKHLAEIFNRFKPLFLAMKANKKMRKVINKLKRESYKYHKPMKEDFLNNITNYISNDKHVDEHKLLTELKRLNIFRKIRLLDALTYREANSDSIVYTIRNNKSYAKKFSFNNSDKIKDIKYVVIQSIIESMKKNVKGKKFFIPENVKYVLPSSEKQFVGNIPEGSYIETNKNTVFGVHWNNVKDESIDLDLSLITKEGQKIGWDSDYRSDYRDILFSGDVTDAPGENGASELFFINKQKDNNMLLSLNYYNYMENIPVPYQIMIGEEEATNIKENYMINTNNIKCKIKTIIENKQKIIGLITTTTNNCKYYFINKINGNNITSSNKDYMQHFRNYLVTKTKTKSYLNRFLIDAGAILVENKEEADIDLSIENIEKDTILTLISEQK